MPLYKVLAVFALGMALDSAVLSPRIVGSKVGLHPLWLIFALFAFSYALGFTGMLIGVPLAAAMAVLVRYGLQTYLASDMYAGKSMSPPGGAPGMPLPAPVAAPITGGPNAGKPAP